MDELRKAVFSLECQVKILQGKIESLEDRIEILEGDEPVKGDTGNHPKCQNCKFMANECKHPEATYYLYHDDDDECPFKEGSGI